MIGISKPCPPGSKGSGLFWWGILFIGTLVVGLLAVSFGMEAGGIPCLLYALAATVFLVGQVTGFVLSQVKYSESIEQAKFDMLVNEEAEWAHLTKF